MKLLYIIVAVSIATVASEYTCQSDCPGIEMLTAHEAMCCNSSNHGKVLKFNGEEGRQNMVFCPSSMPSVCGAPVVFSSCADILAADPSASSGSYDITLANGSTINVYCDMEGANCNGEGGWMRIANIDLAADPDATCPDGFNLVTTSEGRLCYQETANAIRRCDSSFFSSKTLSYSKVCGRVRGYRDGNLNAFGSAQTPHNIDSYYVDGVSITHDSSPRQHIWTYVGSFSAYFSPGTWANVCPCNAGNSYEPPLFVGANYYCESADASRSSLFDDPLWDGEECVANEAPCCMDNNAPWFFRMLGVATSSDVELRVCASAFATFQDTPLDLIELYVM